ncbi:MAG: hypothetical protein K6F96_05870 [Bacteroidales bacterium]|nr:hypothetical protein [Bacteroidales bacterium]
MKRLFWLLPVLLAMLVTGCLKENLNDPKTIVLMGTESDVKPIEEVIPNVLLDYIQDADSMSLPLVLNLPSGANPPDIQGEFIFTPVELYKSNVQTQSYIDTMFLRFGGEPSTYQVEKVYHVGDTLIQGSDTTVLSADTTIITMETYYPNGQQNMLVPVDFKGEVAEGDEYKTKSTNAFVMGNGDDFTVYFTVDYDCEVNVEGQQTEFKLKKGYIVTGTMTPNGIDHAVVVCINMEVDNVAVQSLENQIFCYRVRSNTGGPFGMAIRQQWYHN